MVDTKQATKFGQGIGLVLPATNTCTLDTRLVPNNRPRTKGGTFTETTSGESMKNMDWKKYQELAFILLDGEEKTGMTWEQYKKNGKR